MDNTRRPSIRFFIALHLAVLLFSFSSVFSKLASRYPFLSFKFILFYGLSLGVCAVYAILWQQILKKIPLSTAYSNRIVTTIWSMIWGVVLFHEKVSISMLIGTAIILFGLRLVVTADE